jgi:steroid 5-alpha reductase family enzyme
MSVGAAIKSIYAVLFVAEQEMPPSNAVIIGLFITIFDALNSILFTIRFTSAGNHPSFKFLLGTVLYAIGLSAEAISEIQRRRFKDKPANKGKVYSGGLFSLARHINYGGYTVWRTGYALASSGWIWAALTFCWSFGDFSSRGVPVLDVYCQKRVRLSCTIACHGSMLIQYGSTENSGLNSSVRCHTSYFQESIRILS